MGKWKITSTKPFQKVTCACRIITRDAKGFFILHGDTFDVLISAENPLASLNISQDGELVMPAMATPGEFSIECDRSDTDHVCLGKIRDNYAFSENF